MTAEYRNTRPSRDELLVSTKQQVMDAMKFMATQRGIITPRVIVSNAVLWHGRWDVEVVNQGGNVIVWAHTPHGAIDCTALFSDDDDINDDDIDECPEFETGLFGDY